jgi:osmotically inducible lipoprotein OsmB
MKRYALISLAGLTLIGLSACSTPEQTVGTTAGVVGGAMVGGPVGAVVGGAVGAVATEPGMPMGAHGRRCHYRDRYGHRHWRYC